MKLTGNFQWSLLMIEVYSGGQKSKVEVTACRRHGEGIHVDVLQGFDTVVWMTQAHPTCKKRPVSVMSAKVVFLSEWKKEVTRGNRLTQIRVEKGPVKLCFYCTRVRLPPKTN